MPAGMVADWSERYVYLGLIATGALLFVQAIKK
jgi:hypothetical protein